MIILSSALARDVARMRRRQRIVRIAPIVLAGVGVLLLPQHLLHALLLPPLGTMRLAPGQRDAMLNASFNGVGISIDNFILEGRTGAQPATADLVPTGTVVFSMTLPADAVAAAATQTVTQLGTWQDASADAPGTGGWMRIRAAGDAGTTNTTDRRIDGAITATGSGGELQLQNVVIASGQQITITSVSITQPAQ